METNIKDKILNVISSENIINSEIESIEQDNNKLNVNIKIKPNVSIKTVKAKFEKPEGMSDAQFKVMLKRLQQEIENQNIKEHELTS